jgi:hypothetical protein
MAKRGNPNWVKGVSGNPGGRHKGVKEVKELAQAHAADAVRTLAEICKTGQSEAARVAAASAILDRAYGKPTQTVNTNVRRSLVNLTDEELAAIAAGGGEGAAGEEESEEELSSLH